MKVCEKIVRTSGSAAVAVAMALSVVASPGSSFAQNLKTAGSDTVALVDGKPITASEFRERFELTIYPNKGNKEGLQAEKERFLFSLIAERLLADEGMKSGEFMTPQENQLRQEATQTYLRDALYRKEILSKVSVTDKDIMEGIEKAVHRYFIRIYYFPDSSRAGLFYGECAHLIPARIDSVVSAQRVPTDTVHVVYSELVKPQEDVIWGRHSGFISRPVRGQGAFIVIRILAGQFDAEFSRLTPEEKVARVRKIIQTRREIAATQKYAMSVLGNVRATAIPALVRMLADSISYELKRQEPSRLALYYNLRAGEIEDLLRKFRDKEKLPMIWIRWMDSSRKARSMSVREVIDNLLPAEFLSKGTSRPDVATGLRNTIRRAIEYNILAKEAEKSNLENSDEVQKNVDLIMRAYFASQMREAVVDTVRLSQSDIDRFMREYNASDLKNTRLTLQEFHARTVDEALSVYNVVSTLDSMSETMRESIMCQMDVDTLSSNAFLLGTIGSMFSRLEPGQIYGPVRNRDGYVLYRLLSKETSIPDNALSLAVDTTKMIALNEKQDSVLYHYVASLASKSNLKIFLEALKKVEVEPIQMFTVRKIGFGGTINAVPGLAVMEEWTRVAPMEEIIIP